MKTKITLVLSLIVVFNFYAQDILIAGVGHGFYGNAGFIEVYVKSNIDNGNYYVKAYNPQNELIGYKELYAPLSAGQKIYISSDDFIFPTFFDTTEPYFFAESVGFINGSHTVTIEAEDFTTIIDIYGEIGVNGIGSAWEYSRGWAYRLNGYGPNTTFTLSEWNIQDDAFISCSGTNASCTMPYPMGSYTLSSDSIKLSEFRLFPNPTNNGFVQIYGNKQSTISIQIFDVFGKQLSSTELKNNKLDISHLNPGVYFLKMSQDNASSTKKLVVK